MDLSRKTYWCKNSGLQVAVIPEVKQPRHKSRVMTKGFTQK